MRKLIIVQARMTSTRLPGKVMKIVCDKPLLEHLIDRLKRVKYADQIVIATTVNETDDQIVALCKKLDISCFRGSEEDVLGRYYEAAVEYGGDVIIRITSDCPLIDPHIVDQVIAYYVDNKDNVDYVSNCLNRTYPKGMGVEVFPSSILKEAYEEAKEAHDREHVTPFIKNRSSRYRLGDIEHSTDLSHYRLTVDTPEDMELIRRIFESLYYQNPLFSLKDMLDQMERTPEWETINTHVEIKKYGH